MSNETIMLSKGFNLDKVTYPCFVTEKLDGVAAIFTGTAGNAPATVLSRQGKPITSVAHLCEALRHIPEGYHIVGELYVCGMDFKDISGMVRQQQAAEELELHCYDGYFMEGTEDYKRRREVLYGILDYVIDNHIVSMSISEYMCDSESYLLQHIKNYFNANPEAEGVVIRNAHGKDSRYYAGKRSWGMMKLKQKATADLRVVGIEEATSKDGESKMMLGRIIVLWHGKPVGVGPGKMIHEDRKAIWKHPYHLINQIIEVDYMPDPSYGAMREPRFIRYRPDKTEESYE